MAEHWDIARVERRLRATPHGAPARRLSRLLTWRGAHFKRRRSAPLLDIVARLADRLRADAVPVRGPQFAAQIELDLFDLFAAENIPFETDEVHHPRLAEWFDDAGPGRRSLEAYATHPDLRAPFRRACLGLLADHQFGAEVGGPPLHPNLLALALSVPGVATALEAEVDAVTARLPEDLNRLEPLCSPAGYAAFGRYLDRVAAFDLDAAAERSRRAGRPGDLTWPEYEAATAGLDPRRTRTDAQWPWLAVHDTGTAIVFDGSGTHVRYTIRIPEREGVFGQLPARCTLHDGRLLVSWFTGIEERGCWADAPDAEFALAGAGIELGGLVVGPLTRLPSGDEHVVPGGRFEPGPGRRWRRAVAPDAPAPFGRRDGETGWDLIETPDGPAVRSIDGRAVPLPPGAPEHGIAGVLRLPVGDRLVTANPFGQVTLWDPGSGRPGFGPEIPPGLPPIGWWDWLRPSGAAGPPATAGLAETIARYRALPDTPAPAPVSVHAHDANLRNALLGLLGGWGFDDGERHTPRPTSGYGMLRHLEGRRGTYVGGWTQVLPGLGAVALRAGLVTTPEPEREALAAFLTAVADAGLADGSRTLLTVLVQADFLAFPAAELGLPVVLAEDCGAGLGRVCQRWLVEGELPQHPRVQVVERVALGGWGGTETVRHFVRLLAERGPARWDLGWRPEGLEPHRAVHLLNAMMPVEPERLWAHGPDLDGFRRAAAVEPPEPYRYQPWIAG
ncbi:hypothetical protein [Dactylosporangium sp. CS-033363]|uniref:hypothetical protein n=1 Tax=Dactylosporangium sp. CS-033363 TaxID=3239935 RepID=UPI003D8F9926